MGFCDIGNDTGGHRAVWKDFFQHGVNRHNIHVFICRIGGPVRILASDHESGFNVSLV